MITFNRIISSVEFSETESNFIVAKFVLNKPTYTFLQKLQNILLEFDLGTLNIIDQFGDEFNLSGEFDLSRDNDLCRLSISKNRNLNLFFSEVAFSKSLKSNALLHPYYHLTFIGDSFQTNKVKFYGRNAIVLKQPIEGSYLLKVNYNSPSLIKCLTDDAINFLPQIPSQWIVDNYVDTKKIWKDIAGVKLLSSLGSEIILRSEQLEITFRGDRRVELSINTVDRNWLTNIFQAINDACKWIYIDGKDIETRHQIFNNQICNISINEEENFRKQLGKILDRALENSKLAYRYYLLNSNKELNKSLIEVNKTLFDHVNKIRQNTTDLVNSLWKDFATAFGLLVLNFSLKKPDISGKYWNLLLSGLIIYLMISYYLSSSVGFWFYRRLRQSLSDMKIRVYSYLTDSDFEDFAVKPLRNAQNRFLITFYIVLVCYLAIIFLVLFSMKTTQVVKAESIIRYI